MLSSRSLKAFALALLFVLASLPASAVAVVDSPAQAPLDFSLRTADGGEINSEMLRGDVVVLAFGASYLGRKQVQRVQELADEFGERDVRVYWVSTESASPKSKNYATDEQLRAFARKNGLKIAVLRDPEGTLFKQTRADQLPSIVILDRTGNVSGSPVGGFDPEASLVQQLSPRLNRLLGDK